MINIAINGFGRIGRAFFKVAAKQKDIHIKYISDIKDSNNLIYLLEHDSLLGRFNLRMKEKTIIIEGKESFFLDSMHGENPKFNDIDIVVESSGAFLNFKALKSHLLRGARKVILTAPFLELPTYIIGVNENLYKNEKIISNASCSANAIAPIIKTINNKYKIISGNSTTIHPFNSNQSILDNPNPLGARFSRNASLNIIPSKSSIGEIIGLLFADLRGKFLGDSIRVPTSLVSFSNIDLVLEKNIIKDDILNLNFPKIIGLDSKYLVSSDFIGDSRSAIIASDLVSVHDNICRIPVWFDNENAYANRLLDMVRIMHKS